MFILDSNICGRDDILYAPAEVYLEDIPSKDVSV